MKINENQKKLLISTAAIIAGMLFFPPWRRLWGNLTGYDFIFDLPLDASVDIGTLVIQWLGVLLIASILFFVLKGGN